MKHSKKGSLQNSEKENRNIQQNSYDQPDKMAKIQNVLNSLNVKVLKFNEQRKKIEDEVTRNVRYSIASDASLSELSEMLTIQDY
jgi:predicted nuclease with TOPRIM domain